ncbi:MAG TPA: universal stress protein [Steroidobacteraceae bacterium]|nr:universal stress protein [Steroidobacteraceae bacterium]
MIKTILVPASGSDTDDRVFATVLALARPLGAHLRFFHLRLSAYEAAVRSRHVEFCVGPAINDALRHLEERDNDLSATATKHVNDFCAANDIPLRSSPGKSIAVSAQLLQETDHAESRFVSHSRHSDLIVMGRPRHRDLMPSNLIQELLLVSGRPMVIAADSSAAAHIGTIVIGWKESPEAVRSVSAAMPLLKVAGKVVIVHVAETDDAAADGPNPLTEQLSWHGISAQVRSIHAPSARIPDVLAATVSEIGADLLVVGGYGHGPWREAVFGGVTTTLINHAQCPVFMMH